MKNSSIFIKYSWTGLIWFFKILSFVALYSHWLQRHILIDIRQGLIRYVSSKYSVLELYIHIDYKDTFSWTGFIWFIMVSTLSALSSSDNSITDLAGVSSSSMPMVGWNLVCPVPSWATTSKRGELDRVPKKPAEKRENRGCWWQERGHYLIQQLHSAALLPHNSALHQSRPRRP